MKSWSKLRITLLVMLLLALAVVAGRVGIGSRNGASGALRKAAGSFKHHDRFAAGIKGCDRIALFEGLPHPHWENELLDSERRSKKTTEIAGSFFYEEALPLNQADAHRLKELYCNQTSFTPLVGMKACGGFHPDYCIEWSDVRERYLVQICFGCHEMKTFFNGKELYCDIGQQAYDEFEKILTKYRKNRPAQRSSSD